MKLCSACLLGLKCRYDGESKPNEKLLSLSKEEILIPVCPEQLGGQSTPRSDAGIHGGDGFDVLEGKAKVLESDSTDVTENFVRGAEEVYKIAEIFDIKEVILKQRSPSCGSGQIYDRNSSRIIKGEGVTTALLKKNGIKVISEEEL